MEKSNHDRISGLPDGILHCILRRLPSQEQAAQTIALSRRWRSLWRSYPIVEYDYQIRNRPEDIHKFGDASIQRFSTLDSLFRIEILNLSLELDDECFFNSSLLADQLQVVEQLLKLASERKAEEVAIKFIKDWSMPAVRCPFQLILNSRAKILRLQGIQFPDWDDYQLPSRSLKLLQSLHLDFVELDGLYTSLIANSPLLETLELRQVVARNKKFQISNLFNLKNIKIRGTDSLEEFDITAPRLQNLYLELSAPATKIEVTAPQLRSLVIWRLRDFPVDELISKLPSLKSLTLSGFSSSVKKLKFSSPNLKRLRVLVPIGFKEIELECGPHLTEFFMHCGHGFFPHELEQCRIDKAPRCQWTIVVMVERSPSATDDWLVDFKRFIDKFTKFRSVFIGFKDNLQKARFKEEGLDRDVRPATMSDMGFRIRASWDVDDDVKAFMDGLFWACRS
ncbi:Putative F-box/FBD/LRR-repeat protein At5g22670 [Linum grandiflorum]